jgi:hypothetical protein
VRLLTFFLINAQIKAIVGLFLLMCTWSLHDYSCSSFFHSYYFRLLNPSRHIMYLRLELPGSWVVHIGSSRFDNAAYRFWDITWLCYWKIAWPLYYELFVLVIHLGITNYHQTFVAVAHSPNTRQRTFIQSNVLSTRLISTLI